jgi:hypothetical protein
MPERLFRYVAPPRLSAYTAAGWIIIGETLSPHDGRPVTIVEWPHAHLLPIEPEPAPPSTLAQIVAPSFCAGVVFEHETVARAAPIVRFMARKAWTRQQVFSYCRERGWAVTSVP